MEYTDFCSDAEKMHDFLLMDKESFLEAYSYLTEAEWIKTYNKVMWACGVVRCDV